MRNAGGGGLAQQGGDDAPDARQVIAAAGAGPLAVGAVWRRSALLALLAVLVLALAGAGPLRGLRWVILPSVVLGRRGWKLQSR